MNLQNTALPPPSRLALAYAKCQSRAFLELLLTTEMRLAAIISNGKEPLIGQMRMAWWRDVIAKPAAQRPKGEPLLTQLTALGETAIGGIAQRAMLQLIDAWDVLLTDAIWTPEVLRNHAQSKAEAVFTGFADVMGLAEPSMTRITQAGEYWALAGLLRHCQTAPQYDAVTAALAAQPARCSLHRELRPLAILAFAARQEYTAEQGNLRQGLRIIFNALTGR